jgi:hypothetical protein
MVLEEFEDTRNTLKRQSGLKTQFDKPVEGQDRTIMITAETLTLLGFLMAAMIFLNEFQSTGFGM